MRGKVEERTGWREQNESQIIGEEKRSDRLVGAAKTSKEHAESRRLQQKNLNKLGLPKRKDGPQCHRESSWQERWSCPYKKEKEQSRQSKAPDYEGGESEDGRELHLGERGGIRARAWRDKGGLHGEGRQIPRRKGRASKKSLPRTSRRKHEWVSGHKSSPG